MVGRPADRRQPFRPSAATGGRHTNRPPGRTPDATPSPPLLQRGEGPHRHRGRPRGRRLRHPRPGGGVEEGGVSQGGAMWDIHRRDNDWKLHSFVRRTDTTGATLDLDDFTRALVRRNPLGDDKHVCGIEAGTEVFKGSGRPDTVSCSAGVGRTAARGVVGSPRIGYQRSSRTRR
ncbi:hypothetical protein ACFW2D_32440 [Streptomyces sp. NPDC058914]|uniref:GH12 family glycosyl hydrolase domain-containing protein n=1 Tax=Streptomyces sp. NPDC058914 TaxID=3346671 RepID=UPI00368BE41C